MISNEDANPYDRTMLSKWVNGNELPKITLRNDEFLNKYGITLMKKT